MRTLLAAWRLVATMSTCVFADGVVPSVEANIGRTRVFAPDDREQFGSYHALELGLAAGVRVNPRVVVNVRGFGLRAHIPEMVFGDVGVLAYDTMRIYIGAGALYAAMERLWLGGGLGMMRVSVENPGLAVRAVHRPALDLRAAYAIARSDDHAFVFSLALTSFVDTEHTVSLADVSMQLSALLGYQFN